MLLICGNSDDRLVTELVHLGEGADWATKHIDENALFGGTSFAYEAKRLARARGFFEISGQKVALDDVQGAVLRLPRAWWPSREFDLQDQMFVYHETMASWFALFDVLNVPWPTAAVWVGGCKISAIHSTCARAWQTLSMWRQVARAKASGRAAACFRPIGQRKKAWRVFTAQAAAPFRRQVVAPRWSHGSLH